MACALQSEAARDLMLQQLAQDVTCPGVACLAALTKAFARPGEPDADQSCSQHGG